MPALTSRDNQRYRELSSRKVSGAGDRTSAISVRLLSTKSPIGKTRRSHATIVANAIGHGRYLRIYFLGSPSLDLRPGHFICGEQI